MRVKEKTLGGTISLVAGSISIIALVVSWLIIQPFISGPFYIMSDRLSKGGLLFIAGAILGLIALIIGGIFRKKDSSARTGFLLGIISVIISIIIVFWGYCVALYL